jgi:hypothetical protein
LPTILHCVYCISLCSPVSPSWTFSRITSPILRVLKAAGRFDAIFANSG